MEYRQGLEWVCQTGVKQITFKELYVATSHESVYYDNKTNIWSKNNQIPLSLVINYLEQNEAELISSLPWNSPIYKYKHKGTTLQIAAYTEPSVYWERSTGICRSWNLMTDGKCYASLEDKNSLLDI